MAFDALYIILPVAAAIFGAGGGVFVKIYMTRTVQNPRSPRRTRWSKNDHRRTEARRNTEKETILEAKEEVYRLKTENERESKERRSELQRAERRLQQKEESFDKSRIPLSSASSSLQSASRRSMQKKLPSASFMMHSSRNLSALRA